MKKSDRLYFENICKVLGWEFIVGRKHIKLRHPTGKIVSISNSASCQFYKKHVCGDIRRLLRENNEEYKLQDVKLC